MASAYVNELEDESVERLESDGAVISLFAQTELLSDNHNNYSIKHLIAFFSGHGQQRALDDETSRESLIEIKHYLCEVSSSSMPIMLHKLSSSVPIFSPHACSYVGIFPVT